MNSSGRSNPENPTRKETLQAALSGLGLSEKLSCGSLALYPPTGGGEDSGLDLLEEALGAGTFSVREVGSAGSVPELRVVNAGERDVLVLEGDELIGLKQNRTVNSSVLVGSGTSLVLPV